jgi:hypothetical protein
MTGGHYRHDGRERYPDDRPSRVHGREANLVVELAEVGWTPRPDETRSEVVTSSGETQPVATAAARYRTPDTGPTTGLGPRVEKILFVAEQEAAETRRSATRESTAMIERARDEAETLRHEGEQAVLAFRDEVEQYAEERAAELDDRERRLERERENLRVDGELLLADARREADRILTEAASLAESVRVEVENELQERRAEVERQMGWLEESRRAARDLAHMLLEQAGEAPPAEPSPPAGPDRSTEPPRGGDHGDHVERAGRDATVPVDDTVAVPREPARDERGARGRDHDEPASGLSAATTSTSPPTSAPSTSPADAPETPGTTGPRHRHSPRAAPPPELRLAGVLGGVPALAAVEPAAAEEPPAVPSSVPSSVPDRAPRERDDRDWFTVGDNTERLRAVPGYRAGTPGRTA